MSASERDKQLEANRRYLAAEFQRMRARIAGTDTAHAVQEVARARVALAAPSTIDLVADALQLTPFERDVLLLCAGVEMDTVLAAQCAATPEARGRPCASFGLALARLENPHWTALAPVAPLRAWRLVELVDEHGLVASRMAIDERVLHFLTGVNYLDTRLSALVRDYGERRTLAGSHLAVVAKACQALEKQSGSTPVVRLSGDDVAAQQEVAREIAYHAGLHLHVVRAANLPRAAHELDAFIQLWKRESMLLPSALMIECDDDAATTALAARVADQSCHLTFVGGADTAAMMHGALSFVIDKPGVVEQRQLWRDALGATAGRFNGAIDGVSAQFRFSAASIRRTGEALRATLDERAAPDRELWQSCRKQLRGKLDGLAQRVEAVATWDDLVLPAPQTATLRQIAAHVRQRLKVYEEWGFSDKSARGLGISVLFAGESGTGKTMAAEVLANELHLDLYRIDLASTVSKYIGETEKNLRRVFDAAEDSGAVLLFDEADALFGKRSDVQNSHDRYANIEVSYLLQRMEAYRGLAILTTNLHSALDSAFERRLRFTVQFPFPDQHQRERIWRGIFPAQTPLEGVDPVRLARLNVAGGSIRNIALNAAFLAAEADTAVGMSHLAQAARSEAAKRERPFSDAELRGWT
jgi:hypothetical protein